MSWAHLFHVAGVFIKFHVLMSALGGGRLPPQKVPPSGIWPLHRGKVTSPHLTPAVIVSSTYPTQQF